MRREIKQYYKRKFYGGKSIVGRIVDAIMLRAAIFFAAYLWFIGIPLATYVAAALSAIVVVLFSIAAKLYRNERLEKFIVQERERIAIAHAAGRLAVMPRSEFSDIARSIAKERGFTDETCALIPIQTIAPVTEDMVLQSYRAALKLKRKQVVVFSSAEVTKEALGFAHTLLDISFTFVSPSEMAAHISGAITTDSDIDSMVFNEDKEQKEQRVKTRKESLSVSRIRPYIILGIVLLVASFLFKYGMYYRLISGLCFSAAAVSAVFEKRKAF